MDIRLSEIGRVRAPGVGGDGYAVELAPTLTQLRAVLTERQLAAKRRLMRHVKRS